MTTFNTSREIAVSVEEMFAAFSGSLSTTPKHRSVFIRQATQAARMPTDLQEILSRAKLIK